MNEDGDSLEARAVKRRAAYGMVAGDAAGNVIAQCGPNLEMTRPPRNQEEYERNFALMEELRSLLYPNYTGKVDRSIVKTGRGPC
jgi:hypothetical protein